MYGVAWDENFQGAHYERISSVNELKALSGTKYVQARKGKIYSKVKKDLDAGEKVIFFGLPCEVGGLLSFLRSSYNNLITVQLVCHGVTSSKYIAEYCSRLEEKYKSKIVSFNLRDKKNGVDPKYIRVEFENGKVFSELLLASDFGATFVTCDRESCYDCHFKGENRMADITIGDYWGLSAEHKAWHNMGTSLVVTHTLKADDLVSSLGCDSDFMVCRGPEESARNGNPKMYRSGVKAENRQKMMNNISKLGLHRGILASRNFKDCLKLVYYRYLPEWAKKSP